MYAAGLTVREIADLAHHPRATVHRHLQVREQYSPGVRARHEAALAERGPNRPTTTWRRRLTECQAFLTEHGRLPARKGAEAERSLHSWLVIQRHDFHAGTLPAAKVTLLASLGDWCGPTREQVEKEHWEERLGQLITFVREQQRMPRWGRHSTGDEHTLGVWLHIQHQARMRGQLLPQRLATLDTAVPGWRSKQ